MTTCTQCGGLYEAGSDEQACEQERLCRGCADPPGEPDCPVCGGSGGGPEPALFCMACRGTGTVRRTRHRPADGGDVP